MRHELLVGTIVKLLWLSVAPVVWVFVRSWGDFTGYSLPYLMTGVLVNTVLEAVAFYLFVVFVPVPRKAYLALAILLVCLNFRVNVIPVLDSEVLQKVVLLSLVTLIAVVTFVSRRGLAFAMAFSVCLLVQATVQAAASISESQEIVVEDGAERPSGSMKKRDIYLLGFDAMVDEQRFHKYFDSETPWGKYLIGEGFRSIEEVPSPGATTKLTFNYILSLSDVYTKTDLGFINTKFAALVETKSRGYSAQFLFHNNHFGRGVSPFWDYNYPSQSIGVCPFVPRNFGFYLCTRALESYIEKRFGVEAGFSKYKDEVVSRIRAAGRDENSWLTVAHTWMPGHTPPDYRHDDSNTRDFFKAEYRSRSAEAVTYMQDFIANIQEHDPDAVIVVFGDHGAMLSRGWESNSGVEKMFTESEMSAERHAVSLYVYPEHFCRDNIETGYRMHNLLADVFDCLDRNLAPLEPES